MNKFWQYKVYSMADEPAGGGASSDPLPSDPPDDPPADPPPLTSDPSPEPKGYWPDDWQKRLAGEDEKLLKRFSRYASPDDMAKALVAAQNRISSGELKSALPENATAEEVAEWRKDNGIPESPDKYDLKYDSGLVIGEDDRPIIDEFLKAAHESNYTPDQAKKAVEWYFNEQERQTQERLEMDDQDMSLAQDELNVEWGADYRRNINLIHGVLDKFPEDVRDVLKSARLGDGRALFNDPAILKGFAAIALEINPAGTIVPSGVDPAKGVEDEIGEIEKTMRTNRTAYNKDEKMQARYRDLLGVREKLNARK